MNLYFAIRRTREPWQTEQSIVAANSYDAAQTDPPSELTLIGYAAEGLCGTLIGFTGMLWKCEITRTRDYAAMPLSVYVEEYRANNEGKRTPLVRVILDEPALPETQTDRHGTTERRQVGTALPMMDKRLLMSFRKGEE